MKHPTSRAAHARAAAITILALTGALAVTGTATATDLDDVRDQIRQVEQQQATTREAQSQAARNREALTSQIATVEANLAAADARLASTTRQVTQAAKALADAETKLAEAVEHAAQVETDLAVARANEARIKDEIAQNQADQEETRDNLAQIARDAYKQGGLGSVGLTLEVMFTDDRAETLERAQMASVVMRVQDRQIKDLAVQEAAAIVEQDRLEGVRRDVALLLAQAEAAVIAQEQARDEAATARAELEALQAQQEQERDELAARKEEALAALADEQAREDALEASLAELAQTRHGLSAQEADAIAQAEAEARARAGWPSLPAPPRGGVVAPISGVSLTPPVDGPISSGFGMRHHPILDEVLLHAGIDFAGPCGAHVVAAMDGTVHSAAYDGSRGNHVIIDHGVIDGVNLTTSYFHLSSDTVTAGDVVTRGTLIGYEGSTGRSTGCHLHFETRLNGTPVDPLQFL